jgi:hypothetical protein
MRQIHEIEVRSVVARQSDHSAQLAAAIREPRIDGAAQRHDPEARLGDLAQVRRQRAQVVVAIVVAVDMHRLVRQDGDSHRLHSNERCILSTGGK